MNMVEKVAREIATSDFDGDNIWDDLSSGLKTSYMYNARAAIKAMREPNEKMVEAMDEHAGTIAPEYAYEAAIDAALSE